MNNKIRSTKISVKYQNSRTKKTYNLNEYIDTFTYTDNASGEGDTIDISLADKNNRLLKSYYPGKDDMMACSITNYNLNKLKKQFTNSENFHVDKFSYSGLPGQLTIQGISVPKNSSFSKSPKSKTWKATTLKSIAEQICKSTGIKLYYSADTVKIKEFEQSDTTNLSFITSLCETYGFAVKIYSDKLIIFRESDYESKKIVATITEKDIIDGTFSADVEILRTYTGFKFTYKVNEKEQKASLSLSATPKIIVDIGECDNKADGYLKGRAKVNEANKDMIVISFQILGNHKIFATSTINLSGYGNLDGKYYVKQVLHECGSSGYIQTITARKVINRL